MVEGKGSQGSVADYLQHILLALAAVGTFSVLFFLWKYSAYGIDFTDESSYLIWILNPFLYDFSLTQYGFLYHPVSSVLNHDIVTLRRVNVLFTFTLAWLLVYSLLVSIAPEIRRNSIFLFVVSASFAVSSLALFDFMLPTPSYNSLNLQALLIVSIGLLRADKTFSLEGAAGWLLIGAGGWMTFMAKPSSAGLLAVVVFIYLTLTRKFSFKMAAVSVISALILLVISALLIDGSISLFVDRLQIAMEFSRHLGGGHTLAQIIRIDDFQLARSANYFIFLFSILLLLAIWSFRNLERRTRFVGLFISVAFFLLTILITAGVLHRVADFGAFQGLLIFGVAYPSILTALFLQVTRATAPLSTREWAVAFLFLVMPHVFAFGTNGNYWQMGGSALIFWLLAGVTLLGPAMWQGTLWLLVLPLALATQTVTATLLQRGFEEPYRQTQALRLNTAETSMGPHGSTLILSEGYADYIRNAVASARRAGFEPKTPMIDLSGQSPGILYALGAESIGQAWTIGGYPGSVKLAAAGLSRVSCEQIAQAWVLYEKDGPRTISNELMLTLGADFPEGYNQVGAWQTAQGAGGYALPRSQELYKPARPQETLKACQTIRTSARK